MSATEIDLADVLREGDLILVATGAGEPVGLLEQLVRRRHELPRVRLLLNFRLTDVLRPEHLDAIDVTVLGAYGTNGPLVAAGADVLPVNNSDLPDLVEYGPIRPDVVLAVSAPPGEDGSYDLGVTADVAPIGCRVARAVVLEVNPNVPRTGGAARIPAELVTATSASDRPLPVLPAAEPGPVETAIAERVAALVPDGATLQLGIGKVPEAVAHALRGHRDLGIHSGLIGDWLIDLVEAGAVTNARKPIDVGVSVAGVVMGGPRLYAWVHENPAVAMRDMRSTHAPEVLARLDNLVTINSAIEVDLSGQVNAEVVGERYIGAVGGQVDYVRAGSRARHGRSILAMPATTSRGASRIVDRLPQGVVTTGRSDVDLIVTEYGVADLRGRTLAERRRRLAAIAAPEHRERWA